MNNLENKYIKEFKNILLSEQVNLLDHIDQEIITMWLKDNPNIILINDNLLPNTLMINNDNNYYTLKSLSNYKKGDIIFTNKILYINNNSIVIMKINNKFTLLDIFKLTVNNIHNRTFYYFDSFCDHHCEPNCIMEFISEYEYNCIALKDINVGDTITNDYTLFDKNNDCKFECNCKSTICKKYI